MNDFEIEDAVLPRPQQIAEDEQGSLDWQASASTSCI